MADLGDGLGGQEVLRFAEKAFRFEGGLGRSTRREGAVWEGGGDFDEAEEEEVIARPHWVVALE